VTEKNPVRRHEGQDVHVFVSAQTFWLELGDLRRLVAAADGLPDTADFLIYGTSESSRREEYYVKHAHVRHLGDAVAPAVAEPDEPLPPLETRLRNHVSDWQANAGSRDLGAAEAVTWNDAARQLLEELDR
jgi:hypothetical protein